MYYKELKSYMPDIQKIFSEIISKYNFEIYLHREDEVWLKSPNCIIKFFIEGYDATYLTTTIQKPYSQTSKPIKIEEIIGKKIDDKIITLVYDAEEKKFLRNQDDETISLLYYSYYLLRHCTDYFEGNFDDVEEDVTETEETKPSLWDKVSKWFHQINRKD